MVEFDMSHWLFFLCWRESVCSCHGLKALSFYHHRLLYVDFCAEREKWMGRTYGAAHAARLNSGVLPLLRGIAIDDTWAPESTAACCIVSRGSLLSRRDGRGQGRERAVEREDVHKLSGDQQSQTPTFHEPDIVIVFVFLGVFLFQRGSGWCSRGREV